MNVRDYSEIIEKTAVFPREIGVGYTTLGLIGESKELLDKIEDVADRYLSSNNSGDITKYTQKLKNSSRDILKEIGDVYWYIAATCHVLGIDLEEIMVEVKIPFSMYPNVQTRASQVVLLSTTLSEPSKKFLRDGKEVDKDMFKKVLKEVYIHLSSIGFTFFSNPEEIRQINYDKLIKRRETNTLHGSGDNREENA